MVKINIEKKYLILIGAIFVFLIGINLVVGSWGEDSSHGMWHEDEDIKISTEYSLSDIIGSDGKIHCDKIKGDASEDFCNIEIGGSSGGTSIIDESLTCELLYDSVTEGTGNIGWQAREIPSQCQNGFCIYHGIVYASGNEVIRSSAPITQIHKEGSFHNIKEDIDEIYTYDVASKGFYNFGNSSENFVNGDLVPEGFMGYKYGKYDILILQDDANYYNVLTETSREKVSVYCAPNDLWRCTLYVCY